MFKKQTDYVETLPVEINEISKHNCDSCPAVSQVKYDILRSDGTFGELYMCHHHWNKHKAKLEESGAILAYKSPLVMRSESGRPIPLGTTGSTMPLDNPEAHKLTHPEPSKTKLPGLGNVPSQAKLRKEERRREKEAKKLMHGSFMERLEARWNNRLEQRNQGF